MGGCMSQQNAGLSGVVTSNDIQPAPISASKNVTPPISSLPSTTNTHQTHNNNPSPVSGATSRPLVIQVSPSLKHPSVGVHRSTGSDEVSNHAKTTLKLNNNGSASTSSSHTPLEKQSPSPLDGSGNKGRISMHHSAPAPPQTPPVGQQREHDSSPQQASPMLGPATATPSPTNGSRPLALLSSLRREGLGSLTVPHNNNASSPPLANQLSYSKSIPVDMSVLMPVTSPSYRSRNNDGLHSLSTPHFFRTTTPTVHTTHIETGLTDDGFFHLNQYIVEMGKWRREAMRRREQRQRRAQERAEARARREQEAGIALEDSEDEEGEEEDDEFDEESTSQEDEYDDEEQATILGRGSYGVVKKVFNTQDGQFYAMKIMSKSLLSKARAFGRQAGDGDGIDGLRREIAILKKVDHPNVVKLVEVLCDDEEDNVYLVMEFAENGCVMSVDLDDGEVEFEDGSVNIVSEPLPVELARQYFRDVLTGLEYLHHQKIIHRDIKPENLLVAADGRVMIADFGVSTLCEGEDNMIASTAGTGVFMSPEMIKSGARNRGFGGPQTDVWSLGVTLFYMLYGRLPWYAKSLPEIYRQICEEPLVFPTGLEYAHIPIAAQYLIRGMLDKDPSTRATIDKMFQCPWVTAEGAWAVDQMCSLNPQLNVWKTQPLVEATVCPMEIQAALVDTKIKKEVQLSPAPVSTLNAHGEQCSILAGLKSLRERLTVWKKDLKKKCDAKKAARALKRQTMTAKVTYVAPVTQQEPPTPTTLNNNSSVVSLKTKYRRSTYNEPELISVVD